MSTPTQPRPDTSARVVVPRPRTPVEPSWDTPVAVAGTASAQPAARPGMFARHPWLIPACGVGATIAAFTAMILLTWLAGGGSLFDR
jgi:hypothetical protein